MFPIQQVFLLKKHWMRIDNRSGGLRPPQQTKIPLARLYYPIWCCGGRRPPLQKRCSWDNCTPLVIPVGFKPTTFRTFSRPSLSALKRKRCSWDNYTLYYMLRRPETSATLVIPVGFKPTTFRTGIWRSIQLSYGTIAILQMQIYANCFKLTNDCCTKNVRNKRFH